jgi:hypothetical protein
MLDGLLGFHAASAARFAAFLRAETRRFSVSMVPLYMFWGGVGD